MSVLILIYIVTVQLLCY